MVYQCGTWYNHLIIINNAACNNFSRIRITFTGIHINNYSLGIRGRAGGKLASAGNTMYTSIWRPNTVKSHGGC
jgi:hypothetical protein